MKRAYNKKQYEPRPSLKESLIEAFRKVHGRLPTERTIRLLRREDDRQQLINNNVDQMDQEEMDHETSHTGFPPPIDRHELYRLQTTMTNSSINTNINTSNVRSTVNNPLTQGELIPQERKLQMDVINRRRQELSRRDSQTLNNSLATTTGNIPDNNTANVLGTNTSRSTSRPASPRSNSSSQPRTSKSPTNHKVGFSLPNSFSFDNYADAFHTLQASPQTQ